jgi:predicted metal-dependent hydrolase
LGIPVGYAELAVRIGLWPLRRLSPLMQLACTTVMEDFTAALAESLLRNPEFQAQVHPDNRGMYKEGFGLIFGRYGLMNRVPKIFKHSLKDGFHPEQHDTGALEEAWRQALFGEQGSLTAHMA